METANAPARRLARPQRTATRDACRLFVLGAGREVHPAEVAQGIGCSVEVVGPALTELKTEGLVRMRVGPHPEGRGPGVLLYRAPALSADPCSSVNPPVDLPRARAVHRVPTSVDAPPPGDEAREVARRAVAATGTTKLTEAVYAIVRAASGPITTAQIAALLPDKPPTSVWPTVTKLVELGRIAPVVVGGATRARRYCIVGHPLTREALESGAPPQSVAPSTSVATTPGRARWMDRRHAPGGATGPRPIALVDLVYGVLAGARSPLSALEITDLMPPGIGATSVSPTVSKLVAMGRIVPVVGATPERFRRYAVAAAATPLSVRTARARRHASERTGRTVPPPAGSADVETAIVNVVRIVGAVSESRLRALLRGEYPMRDLRIRLDKLVAEGALTVTGDDQPVYSAARIAGG